MSNHLRATALATALSGLMLVSSGSFAADSLRVSTGVTYLTGDYGQALSTDILYVPISFKKKTGRWTLGLTIPYLRITGPGGVLPDLGPVGPSGSTKTTESGLGDILVSARYRVYHDADNGLLLNASGKVKLPTADESKGLGSGKTDVYAQLDVYKVSGAWTPFATLGYKAIGDTASTNYNNVVYSALGTTYKFDDKSSAGVRWFMRQKTTDTNDPRRELTLFASHKLSSNWKLQGYAIKGFSDASPDWGLGATIGYTY